VLQAARLQAYRPEVILITGYGSLETSLAAFRKGAYDYLLKPCASAALLECVERAVQRRAFELQLLEAAAHLFPAITRTETSMEQSTPLMTMTNDTSSKASDMSLRPAISLPVVHIGVLSIGRTRYEVVFDGQPVRLTPIEYAVLDYLAQHPGEVCRCCDIVQYTHGLETSNTDAQALVRPHIYNLRKKIDPAYLVTRRGIGYVLVNPCQEAGV
jgi:DNA-binding response OmpR family regulator